MSENKSGGLGKGLAGTVASKGLLKLIMANPLVAVGIVVVALCLVFIYLLFFVDDDTEGDISPEIMERHYELCTPFENDEEFRESYYSNFEGRGIFDNAGPVFLASALRYNIDPVLLASIALHETANGTAEFAKTKNNPGMLRFPDTNEYRDFPNIETGIDALASYLFDNFISRGFITIRQIGNAYAPIENDPHNLNANWVSSVTRITQEFGGLVLNCRDINFGNGVLAYPLPDPYVTSPFGYRVDPITGIRGEFHKGIDFRCSGGDPIYSALEGTVVRVVSGCIIGDYRCGGGYGNYVVLSHGDMYTLYAHMTSVLVNVDEQVTTSQQIGTCGTTGSSTGNHLHFEVQLGWFSHHQDPAPYFEDPNIQNYR